MPLSFSVFFCKKNKPKPQFSGTHVIQGTGKMLVTAVGLNSHTGAVYKLMGVVKNDEPSGNHGTTPTADANVHTPPENDLKNQKKAKKKEESVFQAKLKTLAIRIGAIGKNCRSSKQIDRCIFHSLPPK